MVLSENQVLTLYDVRRLSSGKSTFLNASCLTNVKVSEIPFTTIDANKGVGFVKTDCVCSELKVDDNPKNSDCINGQRFIPINLLDVAGLVPDAHKGKGLGNKFLNDLSKADILLHIVDITGALDKMGNKVVEGANDPYEDILFLEKEINLWFKEILERDDWNRIKRAFVGKKGKFIEEIHKRLSGIKVKKEHISLSLKKTNLENQAPSSWTDADLYEFSKALREISKPILVIANKIDKEISKENLAKLREKYKNPVVPCSALAEYLLRKYNEKGIIEYIPGSKNFNILHGEKLSNKEIETLEKIKINLLDVYNGTGVQNVLNLAIFEFSNQICVYPVSDANNFTDNDGNVLPDVFLVKKGMKLRDFVGEKIHSDLAKHFIFGIDARSKKRLGENYELKNNDVIKIVSAK
ncbi:MAG: YchF-related putative GTPase [Promethearchaeota archaeon]